jgi:hypothetical protein
MCRYRLGCHTGDEFCGEVEIVILLTAVCFQNTPEGLSDTVCRLAAPKSSEGEFGI